MLSAKQLLVKQTAEAFRGRPDMPLMASLDGITQEEASWLPDESTPSIEQLVRHIAWAKSRYCCRGFGRTMVIVDEYVDDNGDSADLPAEFPCGAAWGSGIAAGISEAVKLLEQSQRILTECLESCSDEALEQPIPTNHGKSAAHFFWIMLMHDLYHAGQIRTRRTMYRATARPPGSI
ncbi:MAG TPA: DinB family protein [Pirellulales bacterium]|nr:DinB family protein [Pirellulales bacterium]